MKLFEAKADELPASSVSKWSPPLLLSAKRREINSQKGSVLLLGRSGTGKTYYLVHLMQSDARAAVKSSPVRAVDNTFSQLFVTRSARLCELVKYLYREGGVESIGSSQRVDFRTLEQFIFHMEMARGVTRPSFPQNRNVDFPYFRDKIFPRITSKVSSVLYEVI